MAKSSKDYIFSSYLSLKRLLIYFVVCSLCCQICNPQSSVSKNTTQIIFPSSYETRTGLHSTSTTDSSFAKMQVSTFVTESTLQTLSNQIPLQSQTLSSTTVPSTVLHTETGIVLSTAQPTNHTASTLAGSTLQASQNKNTLDSEILSSITVPSIELHTETISVLSTISPTKTTSDTIAKSTLQASWTQTVVDSNILSSSTVPSVLSQSETRNTLSTISPTKTTSDTIAKSTLQASWTQTVVDSNILSSSIAPPVLLQSKTRSTLSKSSELSQVSYNLQTHDINISSMASFTTIQNRTTRILPLSDDKQSSSIQHGLISSEMTTEPTRIKTTRMLSLNFVTKSSSTEDGPISSDEITVPNNLEITQTLSLNDLTAVTLSSSIDHGLISSEVTTVPTNLKTTQILSFNDVTQSSTIKHGLSSSKETTAPNSLTATQSLPLADVTQFSTTEAGLHSWEKLILTQTEALKQPASSLSKAKLSPTGSYSVITASSLQTTQITLLEISSKSSSSKDSTLYLQERTASHTNYLQTKAESLRTIESLTEVSLASESSSVFGTQPETNKLPVSTSIYLYPDKTALPKNNISSSIYFLESVSFQRDTESSILVGTQYLTNSLPVSTSFYLHPDDVTSSRDIPSSAYFLDSISSKKKIAQSTEDFQATSELSHVMNSNTIIASSFEQESVSDSLYSAETASTRTSTVTFQASMWATGASPEQSASPDTRLYNLNQATPMQTIFTPTQSYLTGTSWQQFQTLFSGLIHSSVESLTSFSTSTSAKMISTDGYKTSKEVLPVTPAKSTSIGLPLLNTSNKVSEFTTGSPRDISLMKSPSVNTVLTEKQTTSQTEEPKTSLNWTPTKSLVVGSIWIQAASNVSDFTTTSPSAINLKESLSTQMGETKIHQIGSTETSMKSFEVTSTSLQATGKVSKVTLAGDNRTVVKESVLAQTEPTTTNEMSLFGVSLTPIAVESTSSLSTSKTSEFVLKTTSAINPQETLSAQTDSTEKHKVSLTEITLTTTKSSTVKSTLLQISEVAKVTATMPSIMNSKELVSTNKPLSEMQQTSSTKLDVALTTSHMIASTTARLQSVSKVSQVLASLSSGINLKEMTTTQRRSVETQQASLMQDSTTQTMSLVTALKLTSFNVSTSIILKKMTSIQIKSTEAQQTSFTKENITPTMSFLKSLKSTLPQTDSNIFEMPASFSSKLHLKETTSIQTDSTETQETSLIKESMRPTIPFVTPSKSTVSQAEKKVSEVLTILSSRINIEERTSSQTESTERKQTSFVSESMTPTTSLVTASKSTMLQSATRASELPTGLPSSMNIAERISTQLGSSEAYQMTRLTKESKTSTRSFVTKSELTLIQNDSKVSEAPTPSSSSISFKETTSIQRRSGETQQTSLIKESVSQTMSFMTAMKWTSLQSESKVSEVPSRLSSSISPKEMMSSQTESAETQKTSLIRESIAPTMSFVTTLTPTGLQIHSKVSQLPISLSSNIESKEIMSFQSKSTEIQQMSRKTQFSSYEKKSEFITMPRSIETTIPSHTSSTIQTSLPTLMESRLNTSEFTSLFESITTSFRIHTAKTGSLLTTNTRENIIASSTSQLELRSRSLNVIKQSTLVPQQSTVSSLPSYTSVEMKSMSSTMSKSAETSRLSGTYGYEATDKAFFSASALSTKFRALISKSQQDSRTITSPIQSEKPNSTLLTNTVKKIAASSLGLQTSEMVTKQSTLTQQSQQQSAVSVLPSYTSVGLKSVFPTRSNSVESHTPTHISNSEQNKKGYLSTLIDSSTITSTSKSKLDSKTITSDIRTEKSRSVSLTNTVKTFTARLPGMASSEIETKKLSLTQQQSTISYLPSHSGQPTKSVSPKTTKSVEQSIQSHTSSRKPAYTANLATSTESRVKTTASKSQQRSMTTSSYIHAAESSRILTKSKNKTIIASTTSQLDWGGSKVETKQATLGKLQSSTIIVMPSSIIEEFSPTLLAVTRSSSNATTVFEKNMQSRSEINTYNKGTDRLTVVPQGSSSSPFLLIHKSSYIGADKRGKSDALSGWVTASSKGNEKSSFVPVGTIKPHVKGK